MIKNRVNGNYWYGLKETKEWGFTLNVEVNYPTLPVGASGEGCIQREMVALFAPGDSPAHYFLSPRIQKLLGDFDSPFHH
ncbi:MAG: hypothetical protein ACFFCW_06095 [Candidatus Hodarchaeota archaeon]